MESAAIRIKKALKKRNLRQAELAAMTKISKGALSSYISGRYAPKQTNIYRIAKALDVNEEWLMGYDVPMERSAVPVNTDLQHILCHMSRELDISYNQLLNKLLKQGVSNIKRDFDISAQLDSLLHVLKNRGDCPLYYNGSPLDEKHLDLLANAIEIAVEKVEGKKHLIPIAAHQRTDITVTEEMKKYDDDMMNDDELWNR